MWFIDEVKFSFSVVIGKLGKRLWLFNFGGYGLSLSEDQLAFLDVAREFAQKQLAPYAAEWDEQKSSL
ncbi:MAG: hypothetical protein CM15mP120_01870 [Pseudomonadota bacterium]|nr:MAG: hypothetical protein CM15mP120_01870 [Pseudomonadota bacterium]